MEYGKEEVVRILFGDEGDEGFITWRGEADKTS